MPLGKMSFVVGAYPPIHSVIEASIISIYQLFSMRSELFIRCHKNVEEVSAEDESYSDKAVTLLPRDIKPFKHSNQHEHMTFLVLSVTYHSYDSTFNDFSIFTK